MLALTFDPFAPQGCSYKFVKFDQALNIFSLFRKISEVYIFAKNKCVVNQKPPETGDNLSDAHIRLVLTFANIVKQALLLIRVPRYRQQVKMVDVLGNKSVLNIF